MSALRKIRQSGFALALVNGGLEISPASSLTASQREFLKQHKAEIINGLQDEEKIIAWLDHTGETDKEIIEDTLNRCRADQETLRYFLTRANETDRIHQVSMRPIPAA